MPKTQSNTEKIEKIDGVYQSRNLYFLSKLMEAKGLSTMDLAKAMGVTRQAAHHWLAKDDIKLSTAERLFAAFGYVLSFQFTARDGSDLGFNLEDFLARYGGTMTKRLSFIRVALTGLKIDQREAEARAGFGVGTLNYYLSTDDMFVSRIMQLADGLGLSLKISVTKKEDAPEAPREPANQIVEFK